MTGGRAIHFDDWEPEFRDLDIPVSSTAAPHAIITLVCTTFSCGLKAPVIEFPQHRGQIAWSVLKTILGGRCRCCQRWDSYEPLRARSIALSSSSS
jgi:hypothetical protein